MTEPAPLASVVVVGGGFSGAAFALHLLRDFPRAALRLTVIEPGARLGAGLAYGTPDRAHRINVAAARMSVFAEDPQHFDRWLRRMPAAAADGNSYPWRGLFGDYVDTMLREAARHAFPARFAHVRDRAIAATMQDGGWRVTLAGGGTCMANVLVLATGHPPAALPAPLDALRGDRRLIADPWQPGLVQRVGAQDRVLIVGTGLTMMDVLASLDAAGHRGPIVALSRRGLLPRPRTALAVQPRGGFIPAAPGRVLAVLLQVRRAIREAATAGRPWEDCFDALRAEAQHIWATLPAGERRRFLRHLRPFWDVHRYQCAPQAHAVLRRYQADGRLTVMAAALLRADATEDAIHILARPRGATPAQTMRFAYDIVINCTGPGGAAALTANPLLANLAADGLISADALGLGIDTDARGRAIDWAGQMHTRLFVVGPPARGAYGELMGLPQVSAQPRAVAAEAAALLASRARRHAPAGHAWR